MLLGLFFAAYAFGANILAARLIDGVRQGEKPVRRWRRTAAAMMLMGLILAVLSTFAEELVWLLTAFLLLFLTVRLTVDVLTWRRFFMDLDAICTSVDEQTAEKRLALRTPPSGQRAHRGWFTRIALAAYRAHDLGRTERAVRWLDAVDLRPLAPEEVLHLQQYRAAYAISLGQREAARQILASLPSRIRAPRFAEAVDVLRSLLAVIEGDTSDELLRKVQEGRARATGTTADGWATVEAHALAARGDVLGARQVLQSLRERNEHSLARIGRHGGPASAIALRMMDEGPYR